MLRLRSRRSGFESRRPAERKRGRARKTSSSGGGIWFVPPWCNLVARCCGSSSFPATVSP
jgi:hypothetical protein